MELNFLETDSLGVVNDYIQTETSRPVWSDARNVKFQDGAAEKMNGEQEAFDPPSVAPYFLMPVRNASSYFWVYAGLAKVYAHDGTTNADITRTSGGDYSASAADRWTGGVLNGIGILNNPGDDPQMWSPPGIATDLVALSNWPANTSCRAMRTYKNFLVCLDVTKSGTRYPHLVKWSDAADPNTVPSTWDVTDTTARAGEYPLAETDDYCVDCMSLRDTNIVYKQETTWGMQYIGGVNVFRFYSIFDSLGLLAVNCATQFRKGYHAVFGPNDIAFHDGQTATSIVDKRMHRFVYNRINSDEAEKAFTVHNVQEHQVWFCYPSEASTLCNEALVWDYSNNTLGIRELPDLAHAASGIVDLRVTGEAATWNNDADNWNQDTTIWDESNVDVAKHHVLMADPTNTKLLQADTTTGFNGTSMTAWIEKRAIALPVRAPDSPPDTSSMKLCTRLWPRIKGTVGGVVNVYVGRQDSVNDACDYRFTGTYTIGTDQALDPLVSGRLLCVKFESTTDISWRLSGFTMEIRRLGAH